MKSDYSKQHNKNTLSCRRKSNNGTKKSPRQPLPHQEKESPLTDHSNQQESKRSDSYDQSDKQEKMSVVRSVGRSDRTTRS